jgi:hypothetical protein
MQFRSPLEIALGRSTAQIIAARFELENERMSTMSRLSEKLKLAGGVAGRLHAKAEARADEVIAREPVIAERIEDVFAGHFQHLEDAEKAIDALDRDLALMGNEPPGPNFGSSEVEPTEASQHFRALESDVEFPKAAE